MNTQTIIKKRNQEIEIFRPLDSVKTSLSRQEISRNHIIRLLKCGLLVVILTCVLMALRSHNENILKDIQSINKETKTTSERIINLENHVDFLYSHALLEGASKERSPIKAADNSYFVRDTWDVGG